MVLAKKRRSVWDAATGRGPKLRRRCPSTRAAGSAARAHTWGVSSPGLLESTIVLYHVHVNKLFTCLFVWKRPWLCWYRWPLTFKWAVSKLSWNIKSHIVIWQKQNCSGIFVLIFRKHFTLIIKNVNQLNDFAKIWSLQKSGIVFSFWIKILYKVLFLFVFHNNDD